VLQRRLMLSWWDRAVSSGTQDVAFARRTSRG